MVLLMFHHQNESGVANWTQQATQVMETYFVLPILLPTAIRAIVAIAILTPIAKGISLELGIPH